MKYLSILLLLGMSPSLFSQDGALPGFYHTYEDIEAQLDAWDEEFGSTPSGINGIVFHKEVIGYSTKDNLPFWGVKISDNADVDEDEPRVLILGQCHAEEIYGVEISMALINCFLNLISSGGAEECFNSEIASQVFPNLRNIEIWIIPTHNPEGLRVVHGYTDTTGDTTQWIQDVSYRKNKNDVNGDGIFNFDNTVEAGSDSDGVDLNRNYNFNWIFGDELYVEDCNGAYCSHFDYYRGDAPFSDSETQAIRDFAIEKQFLLSIAYHSSRSGNVSEKVIYSWEWGDTKYSPDFDVIHDIGVKIANLTLKDAIDGSTYDPTTSKSMKGNAHDWFYTETGCIQYLIEMGTANMQSADSAHVYQIIEDNFNGAFYLFNRAWGNTNNTSLSADKYQITGHVTNAVDGETVHANVKILEMDGGVLNPRFTDSFGRYRRLLNEGNYTIKITAEGFESYEQSFYSSESEVTEHDVVLNPSPIHDLSLDLTVPNGFPGPFYLIRQTELNTDTLELVSGENQFSWHEGVYRLTIVSEGLSPAVIDLTLMSDETIPIDLIEPEIIFEENFDNLDNWSGTVYWSAEGSLLSQTNFTYNNSIESLLTSSVPIHIEEETDAVFQLSLHYELEWDNDTLSLGLSDINQGQITWLNHWTDQNWVDHTEYIPVTLDSGYYATVIRLKTDGSVQYRGLVMESLTLMKGSTVQLNIIDSAIPISFELNQNFPNPFNAKTNFTFSIPVDGYIDFAIYDLQGRAVSNVKETSFYQRGSHTISYQADHLSSGIYFYSIKNDRHTQFRKMIVLK